MAPKGPKPVVMEANRGTGRNMSFMDQLSGAVSLDSGILIAVFIILGGMSSAVCHTAMAPVYGAIPADEPHNNFLRIAGIISYLACRLPDDIAAQMFKVLTVYVASMPLTMSILLSMSSQLGVDYGPLVTQMITQIPVAVLTNLHCKRALLHHRSTLGQGTPSTNVLLLMLPNVLFVFGERFIRDYLSYFISRYEGFNVVNIQLGIGLSFAALAPSSWVLFAIPAILYTVLFNPHFMSGGTTALLNSIIGQQGWLVLERRQSLTGYVSVLLSDEQGMQVLRCDHSLLGGEWIRTIDRQAEGFGERESVYAVFPMLEAVRLIDRVTLRALHVPEQALTIGLGIGTAPAALIAHGINTTVVELDPAVYHYATKYFSFPENHTAVIKDAAKWVNNQIHEKSADGSLVKKDALATSTYDYVIHDVFSGGSEPAALFTVEFLEGVKQLMKSSGVLAINYAGDVSSPTTLLVLRTIHSVFPNCRMFRDVPPTPDDDVDHEALEDEGYVNEEDDFFNMVIYCSKGKAPVSFRKPVAGDFLGSLTRKQYLLPKPELELSFPVPEVMESRRARNKVIAQADQKAAIGDDVLLTTQTIDLMNEGRLEGAKRHWKIMRGVLPDQVWENW